MLNSLSYHIISYRIMISYSSVAVWDQ